MSRLILAGEDSKVLPLLERLRFSAEHQVTALVVKSGSVAAGLAGIMDLDNLSPEDIKGDNLPAEILISDSDLGENRERLTRIDHQQAGSRWLKTERRRSEENATVLVQSSPPSSAGWSSLATPMAEIQFQRELWREIRRSQRYHLGFTLTIFSIHDPQGSKLGREHFKGEQLSTLPGRVGRRTDLWGCSEDGHLLHLAPEILEQGKIMGKRLKKNMAIDLKSFKGGGWIIRSGQATYPRDGEDARELIDTAYRKLTGKGDRGGDL